MKLIITFLLVLTTFGFGQDFWEHVNSPQYQMNNETYYEYFNQLAFNSNDDIFALSDGKGIYRSTDNGENWTQINNGLTNLEVECLTINSDGTLFVGVMGEAGGFFRSTDNGDNWTSINLGIENISVACIAVNSNMEVFISCPGEGIFHSADNGDNWVKADFLTVGVYSLVINESGDIFAIYGSSNNHLYRSMDNGKSWTSLPNISPSFIEINSNGDLLAVKGGEIYRSTDNGDTWDEVNHDLSSTYHIDDFVFNPNGDIYAYVEEIYSGKGIFLSVDNGNTWTPKNEGLTNLHVRGLAINSKGYIYIGTMESGIFRSINTTTGIEDKYNTPSRYSLNQNYPNPFNPSTKINYSIPNQSNVTLKVFDVLGREIRTLVNKEQPQGNYEVEFNASEFTSGIYFYRIQTGDFVETKKMILLR